MIRVRFIIPKTDNEGVASPLDSIDHALADKFGGFTRSDVVGAWRNDGVVQTEGSFAYDVAVEAEDLCSLLTYIEYFKSWAKQKKLYVEISGGAGLV